MGKIVIRQANRNDAPVIHEIHTRCVWEICKDYYSDDQLHGWTDHRTPEGYFPPIDEGTYFVATNGSQIVGFVDVVPGEIRALFVSPDYINRGIGTILLDKAMKTACQSELVSLQSTLNATGFYAKKGFVEIEERLIRRGDKFLTFVLMHYDTKSHTENSYGSK